MTTWKADMERSANFSRCRRYRYALWRRWAPGDDYVLLVGLNPSTAGTVIRLPLPPLTEETRKDLVKVVRAEVEHARVAIRNIRRDANGDLKDLLKEKEISEDEARYGEEQIQQLTDKSVAEADAMLKTKEEELMTV